MLRFFLVLLLTLVLSLTGFFIIKGYNNKKEVAKVEGVASYTFSDYWPQPIGAFWTMKQLEGFERCPTTARTTWFVTPPDLSFRGAGSRNLENFKTDSCMWNWANSLTSASWVVSYPNYIKTSSGKETHLMRQVGIRRTLLSSTEKVGYKSSYNLPFAQRDTYLKPVSFVTSTIRSPQTLFAGKEDAELSKGQIPYNIFPYDQSVTGQLVDTGLFYVCSKNNNPSGVNLDYDQCTSPSNIADMAWDVSSSKVDLSQIKNDIPYIRNNTGGTALKVTFLEIGGLRYDSKSIGRYKILNDNIPLTDPKLQVGWIACEQWYLVPNIGVVKIDAIGAANTDQKAYATDLLKYVSTLYPGKHPLSKDAITNYCKTLNYSDPLLTERVDNVSRLVLENTNVLQVKNLLRSANSRYGKSFLDSPDAVSTFYDTSVMYLDKGSWYTFDLSKGLWSSMGKLRDVWGDAYSVVIDSTVVKPWTYNRLGNNKTALVWAPEFLNSFIGNNFSQYDLNLKNSHKPKQIIFNNGAYWIWGDGNNKWGCVKNEMGSCRSPFAGGSGIAGEDFQKRSIARSAYGVGPFSNNGPDAVDVTPDGLSLVFVNEGVAWTLNNVGTWSAPKIISEDAFFKTAPEIGGLKPYYPESIVQFSANKYISSYTNTQSPTQQVLFQKGGVYVNYNGKSWETNNIIVNIGLP